MRALAIALALTCSPALAQHQHHAPPAQPTPADPHTGREMPAKADPQAGHDMPAQPDPHAGHATPADPHAGHHMPPAAPAPPVAPSPEAFSGPAIAGETVFDPALFRAARKRALIREHGGGTAWSVMLDRLEYKAKDGRDGYEWEAEGWYGNDDHRLRVTTEGEGSFGAAPESAEIQALYARPIDPWFNVHAGVRHDIRPDPERTHVVVGIDGLAPYWFEVEAQAFLSDKGDITARIEAEYDQRITNNIILAPSLELNLSAQDVPEIGIGAGLSSAELGARLRYEFVPEFAPYVGVEYERSFGRTARLARAAGEDVGGWSLVMGVRAWF